MIIKNNNNNEVGRHQGHRGTQKMNWGQFSVTIKRAIIQMYIEAINMYTRINKICTLNNLHIIYKKKKRDNLFENIKK